jgi:hypothetical protein
MTVKMYAAAFERYGAAVCPRMLHAVASDDMTFSMWFQIYRLSNFHGYDPVIALMIESRASRLSDAIRSSPCGLLPAA